MKRLDIEIRTNKSVYKLFYRSERVAMYKQYMDGMYVGAEMGRIETRKEETIKGTWYPEREVYFANDSWGTSCWTLSNRLTDDELRERFMKYDEEVNNEQNL